MQRYPTRRDSSTPVLVATVAIGTLVAYALASPRRRAALAAAGRSALEAGSRFAAASGERLQEWIPEPVQDSVSRLTDRARGVTEDAATTAAQRLHDAVDRATALMQDVVARARRVPAEDLRGRGARSAALRELDEDIVDEDELERSGAGRSSGRGLMIAAAAVGAGLYAMQRYGGSERVRQKLGADESGVIRLERTIFIDAPPEQVYDLWADYENFPRFMSNVESVRALDGDRSHWKVRGPAGTSVEFDSVAHKQRPSEISWESEPGGTVQNEGRVTFVPEAGGTRATVRMSYRPPAGALGQAVASLFGTDPKQQFEQDLNRMKQFVEGRRVGAAASSL